MTSVNSTIPLLVVMLAVSETTLSIMTPPEEVLQSNVSTETTPMSTEPDEALHLSD